MDPQERISFSRSMRSQSECYSWVEFLQTAINPVVFEKILMYIFCFLLDCIFFHSKAIYFCSKKFISSGSFLFKILLDLFLFYEKYWCNLAKKAQESCAYQILPLNQTCPRYVSESFFLGHDVNMEALKCFCNKSIETFRRESVCMMMPCSI